ncbi:DUF1330 domain-containing protein [Streptomyces caelestis]|jgi:uncharacterized protein (DUF1330 family)|uniref:Uncharacterized protein (DUF1330 family) n=1 Tax=Streptomyces caelestis TaxID=36816 RepID=A0A7W9HD63_9ACTN|nr:DUF1330 domain-containing protein [Streptomyces caelestis]MBB5800107.1 uncharacterized protein (DUF1330 family) [Streptomyces caelestis]GGW86595.1 hypothetical protein GCM10010320_80220 [Streptomyces caelestis]
MPAYVVIDLNVTDPAGFQQYIDGVTPLIERAGARNLLIDEDAVVLEGDWTPSTLVIHEFPSKADLQEFWDAPEYQPLKEMRRKYSAVKVVGGQSPDAS